MSDKEISENLSQIHKRWQNGRESWQTWREIAEEASRFARGRQWTAAQKAANEAAGRHSLTINITTRVARALSGQQRQSRRDVKVEPGKDGRETMASILTGLTRHTMNLRGEQGQRAATDMFDHGVRTGKGYIAYRTDYGEDPFSGDLLIDSPHPLMVTEDPDCREYDLSDCKWIDLARWVPVDDVKAEYPKKFDAPVDGIEADSGFLSMLTGEEDMTELDDESGDDEREPEKCRVLVHTTYNREPAKKICIKDKQAGQVIAFWGDLKASREEAAQVLYSLAADDLMSIPSEVLGKESGRLRRVGIWLAQNMPDRFDFAEHIAQRVNRTVWCGHYELEHDVDYMDGRSDFPVYRFCPYFDGGYVMGVIEMLIDPQSELNKRRSQVLNLLNQTANAGWIVKKIINPAKEALLKMWGSTPGGVFQEDDYGGKLEKIKPNQPATGLLELADRSPIDMEYISGVNAQVMGQEAEQKESGVLNRQRERQGLRVLTPIFDNLDQTMRLFFECLVETIRTTAIYTPDEIEQIIDEMDLFDPDIMERAKAEIVESGMLAEQGVRTPQQADPLTLASLRPEQAQAIQQMDQTQTAEYERQLEPLVRQRALDLTMAELQNWNTGRYGVVISESAESPTQQIQNFAELKELADMGVPVPPQSMVQASGLPRHLKQEITDALAQAQAQPVPE